MQYSENTKNISGFNFFYRMYRKNVICNKRVILLHGAGFDGAQTWADMIPTLYYWDEILVPDIRGTGKSIHNDGVELPFDIDTVITDLVLLIDDLKWIKFDIVGYSFGGLVAMLMKSKVPTYVDKLLMFEPALLEALNSEIRDRQKKLHTISSLIKKRIRDNLDIEHIITFVMRGKLKNKFRAKFVYRPVGLANTLECIANSYTKINRPKLISDQCNVTNMVGSLSPKMKFLSDKLFQRCSTWNNKEIINAHHTFPLDEPFCFSSIINDEMKKHINMQN